MWNYGDYKLHRISFVSSGMIGIKHLNYQLDLIPSRKTNYLSNLHNTDPALKSSESLEYTSIRCRRNTSDLENDTAMNKARIQIASEIF